MKLVRERRPWGMVAVDMDTIGPDPHRPGECRDEYNACGDRIIRTQFELSHPPAKRKPSGQLQWSTPRRSKVTVASTIAAVRKCLDA